MTNKYDLIFPIGPACRPAYYLELSKIRKCAYPFDWLGINLKTILKLFQENFNNFFLEYKEQKEVIDERYRHVIDSNEIICAHHIPFDISLSEGVENFRELMNKRFKRLKENIEKSSNICMITNRNIDEKELIEFLNDFSKLYKDKKIDLINIRNIKENEYQKEIIINSNLKFIEFGFQDINILGDNPHTNSKFWLGNEEKWLKIMEYLKERKKVNE